MSNIFLNFFKEPEPKPVIEDKQKVDKIYKSKRWKILVISYLAYCISYIGRKNLSIAAPSICWPIDQMSKRFFRQLLCVLRSQVFVLLLRLIF